MDILRMALENSEEAVENEETLDQTVPEGDDQAITHLVDACDDHFAADEEMSVAAEAIFGYYDDLAGMIASKSTSSIATGLIIRGVNTHLRSVGLEEISFVAVENYGTLSSEQQATIALEGVGTTLKTWFFQDPVVHFKHWKDIVLDSFKSVGSKLAKYEKKCAQNKAEFEAKKGQLDPTVEVNLHGLWYFFTTRDGQPKNFMSSLAKDLSMSTYVLTRYPAAVIAEIEKLTSTVKSGNAKSKANIEALAKKVASLKSPAELFDSAYLGEGKYFNVTSLNAEAGNGGGDRLSQLGRSGTVVESTSTGHTVGKVGNFALRQGALGPVGKAAMTAGSIAASEEVHLSVRDLGEVFEAAQAYLNNVRTFLGMEQKFGHAVDALGAAMTALGKTAGEQPDPEIGSVGDKIEAYGKTLTRAFQRPALQEVARSIRASKYCNYFGLRGIFNG
jgi:hypothetical protein